MSQIKGLEQKMISYKLALVLKNAGFLQNENKWTCENYESGDLVFEKEMVYRPTISELIEECGEKIVLHSPCSYDVNEEYYMPSRENWVAFKQEIDGNKFPDSYGTMREEGKTPEIAVAKLWLKLQENEKK